MRNMAGSAIALKILFVGLMVHVNFQAVGSAGLDAHIHGLSELTIAVENQTLAIEIKSPAMNIVGFEHRAVTQKEVALVKKSEQLLGMHGNVFSFNGGDCELLKNRVDVSNLMDVNHELHEHSNSPKQNENSEIEVQHGEIIINYHYLCKKPSTLSAITVKVFDLFSGVNEINTRWLTETEQGSAILNPYNKVIKLR